MVQGTPTHLILNISAGAMQDEDDREGGKGARRELEGKEMGKSTSGWTPREQLLGSKS